MLVLSKYLTLGVRIFRELAFQVQPTEFREKERGNVGAAAAHESLRSRTAHSAGQVRSAPLLSSDKRLYRSVG